MKLRDELEDVHGKIKDDLARLKLAKLLDSQSQGCFRKLESEYVYVYEHSGYTECSAARLSQFKITGDVKDSVNLIYNLEHEKEDEFLPFFYPNPVLPTLYNRIDQQCTCPTKKSKIKEWQDRLAYVAEKVTTYPLHIVIQIIGNYHVTKIITYVVNLSNLSIFLIISYNIHHTIKLDYIT